MKRLSLTQFFLFISIGIVGKSHCLKGDSQVGPALYCLTEPTDTSALSAWELIKQILHDVAIGTTLGGSIFMFLKSENRAEHQLRAAINQIDQESDQEVMRAFFERERPSIFMENSAYEHDFSLGAIGIGFMTFAVSLVVRGYRHLFNRNREHVDSIASKGAEIS